MGRKRDVADMPPKKGPGKKAKRQQAPDLPILDDEESEKKSLSHRQKQRAVKRDLKKVELQKKKDLKKAEKAKKRKAVKPAVVDSAPPAKRAKVASLFDSDDDDDVKRDDDNQQEEEGASSGDDNDEGGVESYDEEDDEEEDYEVMAEHNCPRCHCVKRKADLNQREADYVSDSASSEDSSSIQFPTLKF